MENCCPICHRSGSVLMEIDSERIYQCSKCGHQYLLNETSPPVDIYDDGYFNSGEAGYSDYHKEGQMLRDKGQWYAQKLQNYMSPGHMLDVGAAAGYLLQGFSDNGWTGTGLEPNNTMTDYGREKLGLEMKLGFLETADFNEKFDLVSLIQVVAHFYDLGAAFEKISSLTKPGGYLLIETWRRDSLTAKMFGSSWHEYSPPSVRHWFTVSGLDELMRKYGFHKVCSGRPKKRLSGCHARSLLQHKGVNSKLVKLIPENLTFFYPFDDIYWVLSKRGGG